MYNINIIYVKIKYMFLSSSSNKRTVVIGLAIVLVLVLGLILYYHLRDEPFIDVMYGGSIIEVKDNSIVVEGELVLPSGRVNKTIEFVITPETVITKKVVIMDLSAKSVYTPETRIESGKIPELRIKKSVDMVKSSKNLVTNSKVVAKEIGYSGFSYENKPQ